MITTNKTKLPEAAAKPAQVLTTNDRTPREFNFMPRTINGVQAVKTRKVKGPMMTTEALEKQARINRRADALSAIKANRQAAKAQAKAEPAEIEKRRRGRPRRDDHV